jgi:hypothetical protein
MGDLPRWHGSPEFCMFAFVVSDKLPWRIVHAQAKALSVSVGAFIRRHMR